MSDENVALVRSLYEAFDRGDIPAVIAGGELQGTPAAYGFVHYLTVAGGSVVRFHEYVDPERAVYAR